MKMNKVVSGPLFPVPLPSIKTAHVESQEELTTSYQGERGIIVTFIGYFWPTIFLFKTKHIKYEIFAITRDVTD